MSICLNCGADAVAPRSNLDHNRLMHIIRVAQHHWPERHRFKPVGKTASARFEHLRAWLFCQAEYCWIDRFDMASLAGVTTDVAGAMTRVFFDAIEARQGHKFWYPADGGVIQCRTARSGSFDRLDQKGFNELREAICAIVEHELNIPIPILLEEHEAAA